MQTILYSYIMFKQLTKTSIITITDSAWNKMSTIVKTKQSQGFIFSAVSGGCNGLNYKLGLFKDVNELNEFSKRKLKPSKIEKNNIPVYIDPLSEMFLIGTEIDYILEDFDKGIFENKFVFTPDKNIATSCGCGVSFSPK